MNIWVWITICIILFGALLVVHFCSTISGQNARLRAQDRMIEELKQKHDAEKQSIIYQYERRMKAVHEEAENRIKVEKEKIELDRAQLLQKSEKELILNQTTIMGHYLEKLSHMESYAAGMREDMSSILDKIEMLPTWQDLKTGSNTPRSVPIPAFKYIVANILGSDRKITYYTRGSVIYAKTLSNTGYSEWTFEIKFNSTGGINGAYTVSSSNEDSSRPKEIAEQIKAEIIKYISYT